MAYLCRYLALVGLECEQRSCDLTHSRDLLFALSFESPAILSCLSSHQTIRKGKILYQVSWVRTDPEVVSVRLQHSRWKVMPSEEGKPRRRAENGAALSPKGKVFWVLWGQRAARPQRGLCQAGEQETQRLRGRQLFPLGSRQFSRHAPF